MAPRGAAREKMNSLLRMDGGHNLSDMRVVVRPRAVGPACSAPVYSRKLSRRTFMH